MPPKDHVTGQLSPELAELLSQKIREMERLSAAENEKSQQAQKVKGKDAVKRKLKEAKKLVSDPEMPSSEKVKKLWERLQAEHQECRALATEASTRMSTLGSMERQRATVQADLNRVLTVKTKLEALCRQLQAQGDALMEERRRATDHERRRRHELADEYQHTIEEVKKKMDAQAHERARLSRENEELRSSFKKFFDGYDKREKEMVEQQKFQEREVVELNKQLEEFSSRYKKEALREAEATREHRELSDTESQLRHELQVYSNKFSNFQDAISKSNKVLEQYKRQRNKMQRRVEQLEKENQELRSRSEKRLVSTQKDRDQAVQQKEALHAKCKALQVERQKLLEECAREGT